ncbi:hypothetical protein HY379_01870 [Candidatus Saccharibacteria bacterium]|nr:hypothetical protein [Candidatus Saccharibacteria bacterium]
MAKNDILRRIAAVAGEAFRQGNCVKVSRLYNEAYNQVQNVSQHAVVQAFRDAGVNFDVLPKRDPTLME